jgi:hypothetical protein
LLYSETAFDFKGSPLRYYFLFDNNNNNSLGLDSLMGSVVSVVVEGMVTSWGNAEKLLSGRCCHTKVMPLAAEYCASKRALAS